MMYPGWQLKSTTLAANWCSKGRRLDVLPRKAPAWLWVSEHKHSVCEKCQVQLVNTFILEMTTLSWWREELPGRRGLTILKENPVDETKEMCVLRVDLWRWSITPFGGDGPVPSGLLMYLSARAQRLPKATASARPCLVLPPPPVENHSVLIILDQWFSTRWNSAPLHTPWGHLATSRDILLL